MTGLIEGCRDDQGWVIFMAGSLAGKDLKIHLLWKRISEEMKREHCYKHDLLRQ